MRLPQLFREVLHFEFLEPFVYEPNRDPSSGKMLVTDHTGAQITITLLPWDLSVSIFQHALIEYRSGDGGETAESDPTWDNIRF